jgi:hypothetical protein
MNGKKRGFFTDILPSTNFLSDKKPKPASNSLYKHVTSDKVNLSVYSN